MDSPKPTTSFSANEEESENKETRQKQTTEINSSDYHNNIEETENNEKMDSPKLATNNIEETENNEKMNSSKPSTSFSVNEEETESKDTMDPSNINESSIFYDRINEETDTYLTRLKASLLDLEEMIVRAAQVEVETAALYHSEYWSICKETKQSIEEEKRSIQEEKHEE